MAKNKQQMIFEIDGDVTGLRRTLAQAANSIHSFGAESDDMFGGFTKQFTDLTERFGGFNTGIVGVAGALGLAAGGIYSLVSSSSDYVKTYNEVAKTTGVTVEQLQRLEKQFASTGLTVESFGTINQDTLDKLGDAFRAGGGVSDDLKEYGLDIQQYNKYLNQMDGGIQAVIHTFYEMQKAGKTNAEITNVMETLASDSSHLVSTLKDYSTEQDALNAIQSQHIILTNETAEKYQDFDKKITQLGSSFQLFKAEALGPTLDDIQTLFDLMNKDWSKTDFMQMFRNFYYGGDNAIAKFLRDVDGVDPAGIVGTKEWNAKHKDDKPVLEQPKPAPKGGWVNQEGESAKAAAAATKAEAAAKALAAKKVQAEKNLQQTLSQIGLSDGDVRVKTFQRQQDEIVTKIKESAKTLGKSEQDTNSMLTQAYDSRTKKFKEMIDDMIGYSDPNKNLKTLSDNIAGIGNNMSNDQANYLLEQQNQRVGLNNFGSDESNPFDNSNILAQKQKDLQDEMQLELTLNAQLNEKLGTSHEDYLKRKNAITQKYNTKAMAIEAQNTQAQMDLLANSAGSIGTTMAGAFGEGSKAAQAAFAVQKGITIANTVMKIQEALATALATPFPANLANYASILSMGASIITTAKGAASGQAHSGIDSVPTMGGKDESTWILQAGERVLSKSNNRDLTQYLSNANANGGSDSNPVTVNAPLIIQGSTNMSDAQMNELLKKNSNSVLQSVRSAQKRNS